MDKLIAIVACWIAVVSALPFREHAHPAGHHLQYELEYGVKDVLSGDDRTRWEQRDGHHMKGSYSVKKADGSRPDADHHTNANGGIQILVKHVGDQTIAPETTTHGYPGWALWW
ncbi:cuticle protein 19.8-like [Toxorhynchites rutilus septentrionalis]|uniref:cuticle protein 19.8-like n=1 Tax=Toxorhynchites rutilus septentrionalis TaxID=329112 RepID=UPI00247AE25A|nr:cuticle protein 19.8-like [Toxorhynchites rutilus septentrionalis]